MNQQQPFMMPMPMVAPYPPPQDFHGNEVPARVQVAMQLLQHLSRKSGKSGWGFESMVIEIDGQELQVCEQHAQAAACNMLIEYFKGSLLPTQWEAQTFMMQTRPNQQVSAVPCPLCKGQTKKIKACKMCGGQGRVLMQGPQ